MQLKLKTILNLKEKYSHFVYQDIRLEQSGLEPRIEIQAVPRQGSQDICSGCNKPCAVYDCLKQREFIHISLWGLKVVLLYSMRRVQCPTCGIAVESVPWSTSKSPLTTSYAWFLSEYKWINPNKCQKLIQIPCKPYWLLMWNTIIYYNMAYCLFDRL